MRLDYAAQRLALAASGRGTDPARKRNPAEELKPLKKRADFHLLAGICLPDFDTRKVSLFGYGKGGRT